MTLQASKEPKNRQFLMLLSAIVLVFFLISSLSTFFMQYRRNIRFYFPGILPFLIFLVNLALRGGATAYFATLYKQEKSKLILTCIFGGHLAVGALSLLNNLIVFFRNMNLTSGLAIFLCLLNIVIYGLYTLNVYQDGKLKVICMLLAILSLVFSGLGFLGQIISFFEYLDMGMWLFAITNLATGITSLAFSLFLVVFVASYGATADAPAAAKAPAALTGPERLQLLFQEYQKGNLTEEEFQAKRQEIIENF